MSAAAGRIARANQRALQSMWPRDEAIAWARAQDRWPRTRFRVEGALGNSRLLGKKAAERTGSRYGGHVIELIPPDPSKVRRRRAR